VRVCTLTGPLPDTGTETTPLAGLRHGVALRIVTMQAIDDVVGMVGLAPNPLTLALGRG
jgi:hypothetical protein